MILYLCRHARAQDPRPGLADADRPLTDDGARRFRKAARGFASLQPDISHILTSPALRATQTADILRKALAREESPCILLQTQALAISAKLDALLKEIRALKQAKNILVVGHEPALSHHLATLCSGGRLALEFKKGAIAQIDLDLRQGRGQLLAFLPPKLLRRLA